jgi:hypothetical protein
VLGDAAGVAVSVETEAGGVGVVGVGVQDLGWIRLLRFELLFGQLKP